MHNGIFCGSDIHVRCRSFFTVLFLCCILALSAFSSHAEETVPDPIKVGFVLEGTYNYVDVDGNCRGFDPVAAEKLRQYGRYNQKLIAFENVSEALTALQNGSIDMLMDYSKTDEWEINFSYSEQSLNKQSVFLYTDSRQYAYGDPSQLDGVKIGCIRGSSDEKTLETFCDENHIRPEIMLADNSESMQELLREGKIDAAVLGGYVPSGGHAILMLPPRESYIMFRKEDIRIKSRVDAALNDLITNEPAYLEELYNKYSQYNQGKTADSNIAFSDEEKEYLKEHPVIRVAAVKEASPYIFFQNNVPSGIIPMYYDVLSKATGLTFQFIPFQSTEEAKNAVKNGEADIQGFSYDDAIIASANGLLGTDAYALLSCTQVTTEDFTGKPVSAAVSDRTEKTIRIQLIESGQQEELVPCINVAACYDALVSGRADSIICTMISANWLLNQHGNRMMNFISLPNITCELRGEVRPDDFTLLSILNKGIGASGADMERIITENTFVNGGNLVTMIENLPVQYIISAVAVLIFLIIVLIAALLTLIRREREKETLQAEKEETERQKVLLASVEKYNEERNSFFSTISHDMRTPLNAILGFSELAQEKVISPEVSDYLKKIKTSGEVLMNLINDTLTMSKAGSGKMVLSLKPVRVSEMINKLSVPVAETAEKKNVKLTVIRPERDRVILADELNVQKMLLNLVSNAIKYTPENGKVEVCIKLEPPGGKNPDTIITIKDNGIGMNRDFLPHIYEPFVQENRYHSKTEGTGLGLAIVKKLVDLMDGTIQVESMPGKGTEFTVRLHFEETEESSLEPKAPSGQNKTRFAGRKALLVEDNAMNSEIAGSILRNWGFTVDIEADGKRGVQKFMESSQSEYDIIFMDLRMPVMDGYEAARSIRALSRSDAASVPIVAMSADAFAEDIQKSLDAGMNAHVSKPIDSNLLYQTIAEVLKR